MELNKYLRRTKVLIKKYMDAASLEQFENLDGGKASFDDLVWFHVEPNTGRKTRILTGKHGTKGTGSAGSSAENALRQPYGDLIKVFVIEVFSHSISAGEKKGRIASARRLLSNMVGDLHQQNASTVSDCFSGLKKFDRVIPFIEFCERNGLIPALSQQIRRQVKDNRDRSGHEMDAIRKQKMAREPVIKAIAGIYAKTMTSLTSGHSEPGYFRDAVASFIALLSVAAPNRAAAEVTLLAKQRLQSYAEGDLPAVHSLDWFGSKGFQDNRNHILAALAPAIAKGLDYFSKACQPGRIVARYYSNPDQTLRKLLGDYLVEPARLKHLNLDEKPHLFQLGYALGFYGLEDELFVYSSSDADKKPRYDKSGWREKKIYDLKQSDLISSNINMGATRRGLVKLLNSEFQSYYRRFDPNENRVISIAQVEELMFEFHKQNFPSFPLGFSTGDAGSITMDLALFCVLGHQYYDNSAIRKAGGPPGGSSFYTILTPKCLATSASYDCGRQGTLFKRHGLSSEFFLNFHQLRHYTNTLADRSDIPNEIITAWSGRKSREQTFEYIHSSHEERKARVVAVQTRTDEAAKPIRWISKDEINESLNLPASVTSTGVCTQNLLTNPCEFLNDFISSCFLCPESCHIAGDKDAISTLEKDYELQCRRLHAVENNAHLAVTKTMQSWFITHTRNTSIMKQLIELMKERPSGTVITFNERSSRFNLLDIKTKRIEHVVAKLTNGEEALRKTLQSHTTAETKSTSNEALVNLLTKYSLVETD